MRESERARIVARMPTSTKRTEHGSSTAQKPPGWTHQAPPWTKEDLAEHLRVSRRFLEMEVKRGKLRAVKLGPKCVRFRASDVEKYLEANATE